MRMMNDFWFWLILVGGRRRQSRNAGESPGNNEFKNSIWHMEFEMSLGHLRGRVCHLINEAMYLKALSCKTHSGNVFIVTASNIVT